MPLETGDYCFAIRAAARHVTQFYDHCLVSTGLRATQFSILWRLNRTGPLTINALVMGMVTDRTTLGRNIVPDQADAAVAVDRALVQTAELNLGYTEIHAPFDGRLGRSQVHEGALVTVPGASFNTLIQLDPIYATFNPTETDLERISQAATTGVVDAEIVLGGDVRPRLHGKLPFLDNSVDRTTGTITARVTVDNPRRTVLPGQFVRVRLHVSELTDALLVPQAAVGSSQIGKFVYVVGPDNKVDQRYVSLGPTDGDVVVVTKGVNEGDRVIVGNLQKVGPGTLVQANPGERQGPS